MDMYTLLYLNWITKKDLLYSKKKKKKPSNNYLNTFNNISLPTKRQSLNIALKLPSKAES